MHGRGSPSGVCLAALVCYCCFLLVPAVRGAPSATLPGVAFTLSQDGLNYGVKTAMSAVRAEWGKVPIPGEQGSLTEPVLGTLDYDIHNITLLPNPVLPDPVVRLVSPSSMNVQMSGATFGMTADFDYKAHSWNLEGNGTADVGVTDLSVTVEVSVAALKGRPFLNVTNCNATITDIKIVFGGNATWMQSFVNMLKSTIISEIEAQIVNMTMYYVDQLGNQILSTLPTKEPVLGLVEIDYSLVSNPILSPSSGMSVFLKGEVYALKNPTEAPFSPSPMPHTVTHEMLQVFVSDYVLSSAGFALFKGGFLQYNVTDSDVPSWSPIRLNTSTWSWILPELASKYPNMAMIATVIAKQPPVASFSSQGLSAEAIGAVEFMVVPAPSRYVNVFTLGLNLTASLEISLVNGTKLAGKINDLSPNVTLLWSDVGTIPVSLLSSGVKALIDTLVPIANSYLASGFPLPTFPGLTLVNPKIGYGDHYMYMSSSLTYKPLIVGRTAKESSPRTGGGKQHHLISIN